MRFTIVAHPNGAHDIQYSEDNTERSVVMENTESRPLIRSLQGKAQDRGAFSTSETRKRQNDKWIALQACDLPTHEMRIDPPVAKPANKISGMPQATYLKQLNDRMDRVIAAGQTAQVQKQTKT